MKYNNYSTTCKVDTQIQGSIMEVVGIQYETKSTGVQSLYTSIGSRYAYDVGKQNWRHYLILICCMAILKPEWTQPILISPLCSLLSHSMYGKNTCVITL